MTEHFWNVHPPVLPSVSGSFFLRYSQRGEVLNTQTGWVYQPWQLWSTVHCSFHQQWKETKTGSWETKCPNVLKRSQTPAYPPASGAQTRRDCAQSQSYTFEPVCQRSLWHRPNYRTHITAVLKLFYDFFPSSRWMDLHSVMNQLMR